MVRPAMKRWMKIPPVRRAPVPERDWITATLFSVMERADLPRMSLVVSSLKAA